MIELADGTIMKRNAEKKETVLMNFTDKNGVVRGNLLRNAIFCSNDQKILPLVRAATALAPSVHFTNDQDELI